jgi:hypothetical protein
MLDTSGWTLFFGGLVALASLCSAAAAIVAATVNLRTREHVQRVAAVTLDSNTEVKELSRAVNGRMGELIESAHALGVAETAVKGEKGDRGDRGARGPEGPEHG